MCEFFELQPCDLFRIFLPSGLCHLLMKLTILVFNRFFFPGVMYEMVITHGLGAFECRWKLDVTVNLAFWRH